MPYAVLPLRVSGAAAHRIVNMQPITAFAAGPAANTSTVTINTAAFGPVVQGDMALIAGSTSNDGDYIVMSVIDTNNIEVFPALTVEAAAGDVSIWNQNHEVTITDEATVSYTLIAAALTTANGFDERLFELRDTTYAIAGLTYDVFRTLFRRFNVVHTGATNTDWAVSREVLYNYQSRAFNNTAGYAITSPTGDPGTFEMDIGILADPGDRRSGGEGGVFLGGGMAPPPLGPMTTRTVASYFSGGQNVFVVSDDGQDEGYIISCIADGVGFATPVTAGALDEANFLHQYNPAGLGFLPVGALANSNFLRSADAGTFGVVFATGGGVVLQGLELSDAAFTPSFFVFADVFTVRDPVEDYTAVQLFQNSGAWSRKQYSYNPRFVDINFLTGPVAAVGLEVRIERFTDSQIVQISANGAGTYTITINGEDHTYVAGAGDSTAVIRDNLRNAINAGAQPVTATNNAGTLLPGNYVIINADVTDTLFDLAVASPAGQLIINPDPIGVAATQGVEYAPGEITGSPFTTDANGRINVNGVQLDRFALTQNTIGLRTMNFQYRITVEGAGFRRVVDGFVPTRPFVADFPIEDSRMGNIVP